MMSKLNHNRMQVVLHSYSSVSIKENVADESYSQDNQISAKEDYVHILRRELHLSLGKMICALLVCAMPCSLI
jgi:hypothetical protein